ncbi:MAG: hypothetical protein LBD23_19240 [Oscillospiraceae bacterium]|jgi:hypothetical protein|nr:hypothetical protein [Oscillospiraceae bacterium]
MMNTKKTTRFIACLIMMLLLSNIVMPITFARASSFINSYSTSLSTGGNGNVTVSFNITGTRIMTEIGTTRIELRENGTLVAVYLHTNTSGMMGYNKFIHAGTVTYKGVTGRSYIATVSFRAGNSDGSDSRTVLTNTIVAR